MLSPLPLGHRGSPQYLNFTSERRRNICFLETWMPVFQPPSSKSIPMRESDDAVLETEYTRRNNMQNIMVDD